MDDNPAYREVNIYDRYKGPSSVVYAKQNNSIISSQVLFAQLRKAILGSIRPVNLEQCTTSLCVQEFAPLPYWPYAWY